MFSDLAQSYTVATGSGEGKHVYFYVDDLPPSTFAINSPIGSIELRANDCYVVAPPSIHPVTDNLYTVEKCLDILKVPDLQHIVDWIREFNPASDNTDDGGESQDVPLATGARSLNPAVIRAVEREFLSLGFNRNGEWLNGPCICPENHKNGDRNASFGFNTQTGHSKCFVCGTMLLKDVCHGLQVDPNDYGGLLDSPEPPPVVTKSNGDSPPSPPPPAPPDEDVPSLSAIQLPSWLSQYVGWASRVGNQTPELFHLGMGIWMAAIAIARRIYVNAPWGIRIFPNLYMMFVADTTFYRKTTAYKLGEQVLMAAVSHLLMPTPGSPERFQDALAGHAPSNFDKLPQEQQALVLEAMKFSAQRGLFKDEIAGLFGAFKRDYMAGLKDFVLEIYDCPDRIAKETQAGLAVILDAGPSILGVTTPAGLSSAISMADWDNGLLPRFALLTPEPGYQERPASGQSERTPTSVITGLRALYDALPKPEKSGDGWKAAEAIEMAVESWDACQAYSNLLRKQCDPRQETPLDDRLKGVHGRLHVQAMKIAMICSALESVETGSKNPLVVTPQHWQTGQAIAEHLRLSAARLLDHLDRSGSARQEFRFQDKVLRAIRKGGPGGATLHSVYKNHNLKAAIARQIAKDLVQAGQIVETRIGRAEAYVAAEYVGT